MFTAAVCHGSNVDIEALSLLTILSLTYNIALPCPCLSAARTAHVCSPGQGYNCAMDLGILAHSRLVDFLTIKINFHN